MHTETPSREGVRRLLWFVAIWAAGVLVLGAVTWVFRAMFG
ncbi:MAG: hypothetical protein K0Q76_700 [Panacagrimonas sp.]|jgi:hypothetical protein|nr:DUF2474 family protein [Panacagrimonas sp.]MCC2655592.1 hypothetical protein [Panacagrimonas sp.]